MNIKAFFQLNYGVYIVSSFFQDKFNGQIANVVFQVTADPPQIAVALNKNNLTSEYIKKSKVFSVSVLSQDTPLNFIGKFGFKSGREIDKFRDTNYKIGILKAPIVLDYTLSYFECEVVNFLEVGTHTIFVGIVKEAEVLKDGEPMSYSYYHKIKGGTTQKNAPTYIKEQGGKKDMEKYKCKICGYIYDPEKGDPDSNIPAGTSFNDLPENWVCPVCGASKTDFEKLE